jgi:membrane protein implicated in regulation of membrane protease activity
MNTLYLICFVLGLVLSLLAAFSGLGRLHLGHIHTGHVHAGPIHTGHAVAPHAAGAHKAGPGVSAFNGFTIPAFLCWFGAAGYLMENYSSIITPIVLILASAAGLLGATILYLTLFRLLLPRERVLLPEDTRMEGTIARVSGEIRPNGHIGEILFSQTGARRSAPARSENGLPIPRGTEVVVLQYERGIATIRPLHELAESEALTVNR